jgi:hypothetical protein
MSQDLTDEQEATLEYRRDELRCEECGAYADSICRDCGRPNCVEHEGRYSHVCLGRTL